MSLDFITIIIIKWSEYNPRKDFKKPWWFALSNTLVEDSDFFSFNHGEFKTWIYILSQASKKKSDTITCDLNHAQRVSNILRKDFLSSTKKLQSMRMITVICTDSVQETNCTLHNNTIQDNTEHNNTPVFDFDFESLYRFYPLKKGKAEGITRLKKIITSQDDFDSFQKAIHNYTQNIKANGTESRFIKHFSSFVGTKEIQPWRDWLDVDAGNAIAVTARPAFNKATQRTENNRAAAEAYMKKLSEVKKES